MPKDKKVWEPMKLTYAGDVGDIIKNDAGQGKSSMSADSGDMHKPPGQGSARSALSTRSSSFPLPQATAVAPFCLRTGVR